MSGDEDVDLFGDARALVPVGPRVDLAEERDDEVVRDAADVYRQRGQGARAEACRALAEFYMAREQLFFKSFGQLHPTTGAPIRALAVQAGVIPLALEGKDLMGQAQTGTGKTAAFALPILHRLQAKSRNQQVTRGSRRVRQRRDAADPRADDTR